MILNFLEVRDDAEFNVVLLLFLFLIIENLNLLFVPEIQIFAFDNAILWEFSTKVVDKAYEIDIFFWLYVLFWVFGSNSD